VIKYEHWKYPVQHGSRYGKVVVNFPTWEALGDYVLSIGYTEWAQRVAPMAHPHMGRVIGTQADHFHDVWIRCLSCWELEDGELVIARGPGPRQMHTLMRTGHRRYQFPHDWNFMECLDDADLVSSMTDYLGGQGPTLTRARTHVACAYAHGPVNLETVTGATVRRPSGRTVPLAWGMHARISWKIA